MSWVSIAATLAPMFERRSCDDRVNEAVDLFGVNSLEFAGGGSAAGRPGLPKRLMVGLRYLKHAYKESDEVRAESRGSFCFAGECLFSALKAHVHIHKGEELSPLGRLLVRLDRVGPPCRRAPWGNGDASRQAPLTEDGDMSLRS